MMAHRKQKMGCCMGLVLVILRSHSAFFWEPLLGFFISRIMSLNKNNAMTEINRSSAAKEHKDCRTQQETSTNEMQSQYLGKILFKVLSDFMQWERYWPRVPYTFWIKSFCYVHETQYFLKSLEGCLFLQTHKCILDCQAKFCCAVTCFQQEGSCRKLPYFNWKSKLL